jgi:acyl-CoA ligase (AMP-forming) (exosortase A-associated)
MSALVHQLLTGSALRRPDQTCLVHRGKSLTYSELAENCLKLAGALKQAGVRPGDRVATYLDKSVEEVYGLLASSMVGGVFVDINGLLKGKQVAHILRDSGARVLLTSPGRLKTISRELAGAPELVALVTTSGGTESESEARSSLPRLELTDVLDHGEPLGSPPRRIDADPAGIIYTSGSTGLPKGVVVSHRNVVAGAESVSSYLHNTGDERILSIMPFSFDYGLNQLTTTLLVGATLVLQNYLGPADIVRALEKEDITGLGGIPPVWSQLLQLQWNGERFPHLRYITNTGGRFPEHQVREYRRRLPRTDIYLMFGLTEAFRSTYLEPDQVDRRPTSIGKAIPNAEILVLDEHGKPCPPGQPGELVHRGVHVSLGYWKDPERTAERFRPFPLKPSEIQTQELAVFSGDYVKTDEEGYIYYIGRKDSMIKTSGFRLSPTEVEEHFYSTGKVQDAVAFGVADEQLGQAIWVVASLRAGESISADELLSLASREMPSYMIPQKVSLRETLPRNPNGKIDRPAVEKEYTAQPAAS